MNEAQKSAMRSGIMGVLVIVGMLLGASSAGPAPVDCRAEVLEAAQPLGERLAHIHMSPWIDGPEGVELAAIEAEFRALQAQLSECGA